MSKKHECTAKDIKLALSTKHHRDFFMTEVKDGGTVSRKVGDLRILDAVALDKSWAHKCITGYEVKVNRSDFKGDNKFYSYIPLVHAFYIVTPTGLVDRDELPIDVGLIWYNPEKGSLLTKKKPPYRDIEINTDFLLYIIYNRLESDRHPFHSSRTEYFKEWLEQKRENRHIGYEVSKKLRQEVEHLRDKIRKISQFDATSHERKRYDEMMAVIEASGYQWGDPANWLAERLKADYPVVLDRVEKELKTAIQTIVGARTRAEYDAAQMKIALDNKETERLQ